MPYHQTSEMRLYSSSRQRLYLNASERQRFEHAARQEEPRICTLCLCLLYTGCRISEAINLTVDDIQFDEAMVLIDSLKKRDKTHIRQVPVPEIFAQQVQDWLVSKPHHLKLWPVDRATAWRWVKGVMREADIHGKQATAKGLRHSFGINAVMNYIPLNVVQKWMGHADMRTTAIYAQVHGPEERQLAERMW